MLKEPKSGGEITVQLRELTLPPRRKESAHAGRNVKSRREVTDSTAAKRSWNLTPLLPARHAEV